ncbi:serine-rich adhesin for platelets-like [Argopecten irradians]|uniref:serine-rich adhesin for platelets-like n=1 Tax=Argopecten irradians TaxID=31199 RepID=UPI0037103319
MAEGGDTSEPWESFVERKEVMGWLKEKYSAIQGRRGSHQYRIYGLHGPKKTGKSFLMQNFLQQIQKDVSGNQKVHIATFDFEKIKTFETFLDKLCKLYKVGMHKWRTRRSNHSENDDDDDEEDFTDCTSPIENKMNSEPGNKFIMFLDNLENACGKASKDGKAPDKCKAFLWDKIYGKIIRVLLKECNNLLVFITSTQTQRFAEFSRVSCSKDMPEMDEDEAKRLLQNEVPGCELDDSNLSDIVNLCDGLPPTIKKAGEMFRDGDYTREQITVLLKEFDSKMFLHSDDLYPKEDQYDAQLRKYINCLSRESRKNLRSLARLIRHRGGTININDAALALNFEENTAVFKLRFLLPLRFRGWVDVDKPTAEITMNDYICKSVMDHIKAEEGAEETHPGRSSTNGKAVSSLTTHHPDDDDGDDFDDQSHSANHLIVPSQNSVDKSCRLLEDKDVHVEAAGQSPSEQNATVVSHQTQSRATRLLSEEKPELSVEEKSEPNTAKMEGQYIGNREEKPGYDITLTNAHSMVSNDLSPDETRNRQSSFNFTENIEIMKPVQYKSIPDVNENQSSSDKAAVSGNHSMKTSVNIQSSTKEIASENVHQWKRSDTFEENTTVTYNEKEDQNGKTMQSFISVEDNEKQPSRQSVGSSFESIPEKKINRDGSFDNNLLQEVDDNLETRYQAHVDSRYSSGQIRYSKLGDEMDFKSQMSMSTAMDSTEVTDRSQTYAKCVYSINSRSEQLSEDNLSPNTDVSQYGISSKFNAMSYLGDKDSQSHDPLAEDHEDPMNSSIASDKLFASGKFKPSSLPDVGQDHIPSFDPISHEAVRKKYTQDSDEQNRTTGKNESQMGATQQRSPSRRETDAASPNDNVSDLLVDSHSTGNSPQVTHPTEPAMVQEGSSLFSSITSFISSTFEALKQMES